MSITEDKFLGLVTALFEGGQARPLPAYPKGFLRVGVEALDDAAVIDVGSTSIVLSTDFVRGEGFNLYKKGVLSRYDTGYYLAVANLSDIAAMGVAPAALMVVVRYRKELARETLSALRGVKDACKAHGVVVVGGDSGTYDLPVLVATAVGFAPRGKVLLRSAARPGHRLYMSCDAGFAGTALFYFMQKDKLGLRLTKREESRLAAAWRRPRAETHLAPSLVKIKGVGACQDISDGLQRTAEQLAHASGVRFCIEEARLPINRLTIKVAQQAGISPTTLALSDSVDFGLVLTAKSLPRRLMRKGANSRGFVDIGFVEAGKGMVVFDEAGTFRDANGVPWAQQVDDVTELIRTAGVTSRRPTPR